MIRENLIILPENLRRGIYESIPLHNSVLRYANAVIIYSKYIDGYLFVSKDMTVLDDEDKWVDSDLPVDTYENRHKTVVITSVTLPKLLDKYLQYQCIIGEASKESWYEEADVYYTVAMVRRLIINVKNVVSTGAISEFIAKLDSCLLDVTFYSYDKIKKRIEIMIGE